MTSHPQGSSVWFITGCSTGFGRALANKVLAQGHRAAITARDAAALAPLATQYADRALTIGLDVNDSARASQAVRDANTHFGRIDVLVNNAGYGYFGAVEEGEDEEVRAMFETNFFAVANLIRAVLPIMRTQHAGRIINISSVGGLLSNPGSAYYSASKYAVEGLSEGLAKEVGEHGIHVTLIEPGPFRTDFHGRSTRSTKVTIDAYARTSGARRAQMRSNAGKQPGNPERAAEIILEVAADPDPPLHLVLGTQALARVEEQMAQMRQCLDRGRSWTLSADFTDGKG